MPIEALLMSICIAGSGNGCQKAGEAYFYQTNLHTEANLIQQKYEPYFKDYVFELGLTNIIINKQIVWKYTF